RTAIGEADQHMDATSAGWQQHADAILATTTTALDRVETVNKALRTQAEEVGMATPQGIGRIDELRSTVRSLVGEVAVAAGDAVRQAMEIGRDARDDAQSLMQAMQGTVEQLSGVKSAVSQEVADLARIIGEVRTLAAEARKGLGQETTAPTAAPRSARGRAPASWAVFSRCGPRGWVAPYPRRRPRPKASPAICAPRASTS